jgi:very-short-patch-repair endonuclease
VPQDRLRGTSREIVDTARSLRQRQTTAEAILWSALRGKRAFPERVRRQHAYGQYVLDFWIPSVRIAIELDGSVHDDEFVTAQDIDRTAWLTANNILVMRFRNEAVLDDLEDVIVGIGQAIEARRRPTGSPLPERERGRG